MDQPVAYFDVIFTWPHSSFFLLGFTERVDLVVTLQTFILKVLSSNLRRGTRCSNKVFMLFPQSFQSYAGVLPHTTIVSFLIFPSSPVVLYIPRCRKHHKNNKLVIAGIRTLSIHLVAVCIQPCTVKARPHYSCSSWRRRLMPETARPLRSAMSRVTILLFFILSYKKKT
jgi:hypothetical protein